MTGRPAYDEVKRCCGSRARGLSMQGRFRGGGLLVRMSATAVVPLWCDEPCPLLDACPGLLRPGFLLLVPSAASAELLGWLLKRFLPPVDFHSLALKPRSGSRSSCCRRSFRSLALLPRFLCSHTLLLFPISLSYCPELPVRRRPIPTMCSCPI